VRIAQPCKDGSNETEMGHCPRSNGSPAAMMRAARRLLDVRLDRFEREVRQGAEQKKHPDCVVRGDAISFACEAVDIEALRAHPKFHCFFEGRIERREPDEFQPYGRIARFESRQTNSQFWLYMQPQFRHLAPWRLTYFPDDQLGLRPEEIASMLEAVTKPKIARMEVAFDFGPGSGVDSAYVRQSFVSGKSQTRSVREVANLDHWGSRKGTKFIRSYFKQEIGAQHVEIQFNGRFLRKHQIDDVFQFRRLVTLLPRRHLYFARLDDQKLIHYLRARGVATERIFQILRRVATLDWNLCATLNHLRRHVHVTNVRRLLVPLKTNRLVEEALATWAAMWPEVPPRLG
jgi:hypothetical protein